MDGMILCIYVCVCECVYTCIHISVCTFLLKAKQQMVKVCFVWKDTAVITHHIKL